MGGERQLALTHEDLQAISQLLKPIRTDVQDLKGDMDTVKKKVNALEVTLENVTHHNLSILAENLSDLVQKMDGVLNTKNENMIRDVKVSMLTTKVEKLERDVAELKGKTA